MAKIPAAFAFKSSLVAPGSPHYLRDFSGVFASLGNVGIKWHNTVVAVESVVTAFSQLNRINLQQAHKGGARQISV